MDEPNPVEKCIYLAAPQISRSLIPCLIIAVQLCTLHSFWCMLNVSSHHWLKNPMSLAQCELLLPPMILLAGIANHTHSADIAALILLVCRQGSSSFCVEIDSENPS